jgi:hypothetical protein
MRHSTMLQRTTVISIALLCAIGGAQAGTMDNYTDLIRPNGKARGDAPFQADLDLCYRQTSASRYRQDTPAFKQCMLGRDWRWNSVRMTRGPSGSSGQAPEWTYRGCVFNPADC